jgi:hypothetical protein
MFISVICAKLHQQLRSEDGKKKDKKRKLAALKKKAAGKEGSGSEDEEWTIVKVKIEPGSSSVDGITIFQIACENYYR